MGHIAMKVSCFCGRPSICIKDAIARLNKVTYRACSGKFNVSLKSLSQLQMEYNFDTNTGVPRQNTVANTPTLPSFATLEASVESAHRPGTTTPKPSLIWPGPQSLPINLSPIVLPSLLLTSSVRPHFYAALCTPKQHNNHLPIFLELTFAGAPTPFLIPAAGARALPPRLEKRVRASLLAARLDTDCGDVYVDLNHIALETLPRMSQTEFAFLLRELAPGAYAHAAAESPEWQCDVREWLMTCPHCAERMLGQPADGAWNASYVRHLSEGWCTGQKGYVQWTGGSAVQGGMPHVEA